MPLGAALAQIPGFSTISDFQCRLVAVHDFSDLNAHIFSQQNKLLHPFRRTRTVVVAVF